MSNVLSVDQIQALLGEDKATPKQVGPIRWYDKEMRCGSRRCNSPTYITWKGMPKCTAHVLKLANEHFVELGVND